MVQERVRRVAPNRRPHAAPLRQPLSAAALALPLAGPYLQWRGPVGIKEDGGGCTRGQGLVGPMIIHRAAASRDKEGEPRIMGGDRSMAAP